MVTVLLPPPSSEIMEIHPMQLSGKSEFRTKEKIIQSEGKIISERKKDKKKKESKSTGWRPVSKSILKKSPTATVTYTGSNPHSHFKQEWEQQGKFLSWK